MNKEKIKSELFKEYPYRIETHAHTSPVSRCSQITPAELVQTYKKLNYDAITVVNHFVSYAFDDKSKEDAVKYYLKDYYDTLNEAKKYNMKVYLGLEIRFNNECANDYLLFGADEQIVSKAYDYLELDLQTFRNEVKLKNSVLIHAHPFRSGMKLVDTALLDGIETFNMHPGHNSAVGLAVKYAKENNLKITSAGSDFHYSNVNHEGVAAIRTKTLPNDSFELASILKSGDYLFEIGGNSIVLP